MSFKTDRWVVSYNKNQWSKYCIHAENLIENIYHMLRIRLEKERNCTYIKNRHTFKNQQSHEK